MADGTTDTMDMRTGVNREMVRDRGMECYRPSGAVELPHTAG